MFSYLIHGVSIVPGLQGYKSRTLNDITSKDILPSISPEYLFDLSPLNDLAYETPLSLFFVTLASLYLS